MKNLSAEELELCRLQGKLFEESAALCPCSSPVFVRRFMNSEVAKRFDDGSVLSESSTLRSLADELDAQYGPSAYGSNAFDSETLYWMGYLYRYWSAAFGVPSKRVYKIIQARELGGLYYPYHSLDPLQAIERICEAKGVEPGPAAPSDGYVEEGVALLRKMHQRPSYEYFTLQL